MSEQGISLAIVIVNFRTAGVTVDCLRSLMAAREEMADARVVVVENGSGDDSASVIGREIEAQGWGERIVVLDSERNLGFAGGNNLGLRRVLEAWPEVEYVLLLNSDTLVPAGVLATCRRVMEGDRGLGMMSCKLVSADGSVQGVTRGFPSPLRQTVCALGLPWRWPKLFGWANVYEVAAEKLEEARDCDWIGGAFMFLRRSALEKAGLLDESFFFYGEDIEFCFRFHKAGYRVRYDAAASITHLGGGSSDPTRMAAAARNRHVWAARYLVQRKCYGRAAAWWLRMVDVGVYGMRKAALWCLGRRSSWKYREACDILGTILRRPDAEA